MKHGFQLQNKKLNTHQQSCRPISSLLHFPDPWKMFSTTLNLNTSNWSTRVEPRLLREFQLRKKTKSKTCSITTDVWSIQEWAIIERPQRTLSGGPAHEVCFLMQCSKEIVFLLVTGTAGWGFPYFCQSELIWQKKKIDESFQLLSSPQHTSQLYLRKGEKQKKKSDCGYSSINDSDG